MYVYACLTRDVYMCKIITATQHRDIREKEEGKGLHPCHTKRKRTALMKGSWLTGDSREPPGNPNVSCVRRRLVCTTNTRPPVCPSFVLSLGKRNVNRSRGTMLASGGALGKSGEGRDPADVDDAPAGRILQKGDRIHRRRRLRFVRFRNVGTSFPFYHSLSLSLVHQVQAIVAVLHLHL